MATVAPATATVDPGGSPPVRLNSIPAVDVRLLSQSELYSLSKCSNSSFDLDRGDDVVIPKIDRSVFNESAGSRKQTYSRLRLAPAESSKTAIHRRAPRLRTSHAPAVSVVNDPEQAENSQIVRVLKEVFKPDSGFEDFDPLEVENDVVAPKLLNAEAPGLLNTEAPKLLNPEAAELLNPEAAELLNSEVPEFLNPEVSASLNTEATDMLSPEASVLLIIKSPERLNPEVPELLNNETPEAPECKAPELLNNEVPELVNIETKRKRGRPRKHESAAVIRPPAAKRIRNSTAKKVVVYDNDRDREIVNSRGVKVNLANLCKLEDPYGPEIRRRTVGLSTSDELLGFLRGLNGQWGTTRKKRRVVDASDFGDALPKGWRLSLCIKKKEGHVWLFCRRYISPSGRQFESCKDIAIYLLSIFGDENIDEPIHTRNKNSDDSPLNGSSGNAANLYVQEDLERNSHFHNPSTLPISLTTDCEKQLPSGIVGPIDVHVDDVFKCLKCFLIFEDKDDLFDHKYLSHKDEESPPGSPIPDWSIVIGGVFGCKFCHKTFYEKNQYNEHIGTHAKNENRTTKKTVDPVSISAEIDHNINFAIESKNIDEVFHDLDMNEDVLVEESSDGIGNKCVIENDIPETDKAPDVSVSNSECDIDQDIVVRSNSQDSGSENRAQSSSICEEKGFQANTNDARVCSSFDNLTTGKGKVVYNKSSSGFFHGISSGQNADSETRVHTSIICEEKGFRENINDMHMSMPGSFDQLMSEKGQAVNNEPSSGVFHGLSDGQDAVSETRVQTLSSHEGKDFQENINGRHILSSFSELTSEKGTVVNKESSSGVFHNDLGLDEGCLAERKKLSESESLSLFSNTFKKPVNNSSLISANKQDSFQKLGFASVDQVTHGFVENRLDEQYAVRNSEFDRYGEKEHEHKEYIHIDNDGKSGEANLDEFQVFRSNESINNEDVSLGTSSQNGLNANVMDFNTGKNIEFCSLVPPGNNQAFGFQDGLKFDDIFGDKFDENIHELSLAFGNPNSLYEDTINVNEQKKVGLNGPLVASSKINDAFDVQTDLSMVNNSMVQDLKRVNETRGFQNNENSVYSGRTWGDYKSDEFRNSEDKKFMMGSGGNQMWKTAQGNHLQSSLVNSHAQSQTPNFHSFDIMSQKAQDGLLRHNERYNPSRSEPVEFRFLTDRSEHNPNALQSDPRVVFPYTYNTGIEQGFDSTFWMGKNAMMTNMSGRNVVTSVCTWCRNQFYLPAMAIHQQTQAGVGSLCPSCSAGISGQVNML